MPRGDGMGPAGIGPMSGRGMGYCAGYAEPGYMAAGPGFGRGMGWRHGRGRGMGWRNGWAGRGAWGTAVPQYAAPELSPEGELAMLRNQATYASTQLDALNKRIAELETQKK